MKRAIIILFSVLAIAACGGRGNASSSDSGASAGPQFRTFPATEIPGIYTAPEDKVDYLLDHLWDGFFAAAGKERTDAECTLGVANAEVEQALSNYINILSAAPMPRAQKAVRHLFDQIVTAHQADTSAHVYRIMTEMVARYLYDPNSPMRNEDYFLPFVKALAESPFTSEDSRPGYEYQARMCSINQFGQKVPDIRFRDINGRNHRLYDIQAPFTMLFFSNPGCNACKEIIDQVNSSAVASQMIAGGVVKVLNIYIDEDIDAWRDYEHNYPETWISGYDYTFTIRNSQTYDIRAIPSLYLLDSDKCVIMKDAPTERVIGFLENLIKQ